jgi:formylglycine-generating enzyme
MSKTLATLAVLALISVSGCSSTPSLPKVSSTKSGLNGHRLISIAEGQYKVGVGGNAVNPERNIRLKQFWVSDAETTNEQFSRFVDTTGYRTDAERRGYGMVAIEGMLDWAWNEVIGASWRWPQGTNGPSAASLPTHPVTQISGADAEAYCKWVEGRLPTIDEWEVAARAGVETRWPWGNRYDASKANTWDGADHRHNTRLDGWLYTSPVRSFPANAWGLYDVIGNVFEYCAGLPAGLRTGADSRLIAGRGGSWWCSANTCNFYNLEDIGSMVREGSLSNQGFRVVFDDAFIARATSQIVLHPR